MKQAPKTTSIQFTVQRTRVEYGFVSILVTSDVMDEEGRLDTDKLFACAAEVSNHPEMTWYPEQEDFQVAPIQKAREAEKTLILTPAGEKFFD